MFDKTTKKPFYLITVHNEEKDRNNHVEYNPIVFDLVENKLITDQTMASIYETYYVIKDDKMKLMIEEIENLKK
jgi:hypothetical protein